MASVVLAVIGASFSMASAATSIAIDLEYIGSTTGNSNNANTKIAQNTGTGVAVGTFTGGVIPSTVISGLTQYSLTDPATQSVSGLKNYFAAYLNYTPGDPSTDFIYGFSADIVFPSGMAPISSTGLMDTTTNKLLLWNPVDTNNTGNPTWDTVGDFGSNNFDLKAVTWYQTAASDAGMMLIGQSGAVGNGDAAGYVSGKGTLLGIFALAFTGTGVHGDVTLSALPGNVAWWSNGAGVYDNSVFSANAIPVGQSAPDTPEPASLGVLALGGLALLARRRK